MQYELQVIVSLLKEAPDKILYTVNNSNGFLMVREAMTQKGKGEKKKGHFISNKNMSKDGMRTLIPV